MLVKFRSQERNPRSLSRRPQYWKQQRYCIPFFFYFVYQFVPNDVTLLQSQGTTVKGTQYCLCSFNKFNDWVNIYHKEEKLLPSLPSSAWWVPSQTGRCDIVVEVAGSDVPDRDEYAAVLQALIWAAMTLLGMSKAPTDDCPVLRLKTDSTKLLHLFLNHRHEGSKCLLFLSQDLSTAWKNLGAIAAYCVCLALVMFSCFWSTHTHSFNNIYGQKF